MEQQKTSPTSRLGLKSVIYHGETCLGEVEMTLPAKNQHFQFPNNEIRINHLSQPSERCPPLSVLQTIAPYTIRCKLESKFTNEHSPLYRLYSACFQELKTAVVLLGGEELHLVAMGSREERFPCFWCFAVPLGLYQNCLGMLNLRCLSIVFDLDETLIVANTMKSFEDKIEALQRRIACDNDPLRVSGMTAEMRRYMEDRSILKQYAEADYVMDNGKLLKVQLEEVPPVSGQQERVIRPVIRLPDRNIVLTRINPEIRDTSVLVRLRPAWEDLRSYLTAKGRKRFEVYVCTMAEKDYALEIWRLLDPEAHLISSKQLMDRVVCVKSGSRKSLVNVFQDCICHPKMAMVIDDRLKVWDDKDQPRVHVVPPFTPYYAPQAETANAVPLLCVARNVACNVRAGFFKEFDENLLRKIAELCYEDEVTDLPYAPDVSDYLMPEDASFVPNINREIPISEGMNGAEVDRRMNPLDDKNIFDSSSHHVTINHDLRPDSKQPAAISENLIEPDTSRTVMTLQKPSVIGAGKREVNPFELDHEARKRLLVMHPGQNVRDQSSVDAALLPRASSIQPRGGWLVEEDMNLQHISNRPSGLAEESGPSDPQQAHQVPPSLVPSHVSQVKNEQAYNSHERQKQRLPQSYSQQAHQNLHPPSVESSAPSGMASHASQVKIEQTYVRHGRQSQSVSQSDTQQAYQNLLPPGADGSVSIPSGMNSHLSRVKNEQAYLGHERQRQSPSQTNQSSSGNGVVPNQTCTNNRESQTEAGKVMLRPLSVSIGVLQEIGRRCGSKVEFKSLVNTSKDLQFSIEVLFSGEKIGVGMGKTKKDAQQQAAEEALRCLADRYVAHIADSGRMDRALDKLSLGNENGFLLDNLSPGLDDQKPDITLLPNFSTEANVEEGVLKPVGNQQVRKRGSPPRSPQTISNKRSKEELLRGLPGLPSSQYQKNGNPIS